MEPSSSSFFWLLSEQVEAASAAEELLDEQLVEEPELETEVAKAQLAPPARLQPTPTGKATALLHALRGTDAGVTALLKCPGFAEQEDARNVILTEALMAVLLTGTGGGAGDEASTPSSTSTALGQAAAQTVAVRGAVALTKRLLALGASPNSRAGGTTPLVAALSAGRWEAAGLLLDGGADPDPTTGTEVKAAEQQAVPTPCPPMTPEQGGTGSPASKRKREAATPEAAPEAGSSAATRAGEEVEAQLTPLVVAAATGSAPLVARLLMAGADTGRACVMQLAGGQRGVALTPLVAAVSSGHRDIAAQLLEAGADVHQLCSGGGGADLSSALGSAVLGGSCEMVRLLVDHGACGGKNGGDRVGRDHPGLRVAALAAQLGHSDILELIYPPLAGALQGGSAAMLGCLKHRTVLHPLAAAAQRGQLAAVQKLLELGAPPSHNSSVLAGVQQHTPLMLAAANGHLGVMECLLSAGADPLQLNAQERSAAALALQNGQLAAVRLLLRHTGELEAEAEACATEGPAGVSDAAAASAAVKLPEAGPAGPPTAAAVSQPHAHPSPLRLSSNACQAWQVGFASGSLPCSRPLTLAALHQERQRYEQLLAALLEADESGCGAASPAAARVRSLADPTALALAAAGSQALLGALLACGASLAGVGPADESCPLLARTQPAKQAQT